MKKELLWTVLAVIAGAIVVGALKLAFPKLTGTVQGFIPKLY